MSSGVPIRPPDHSSAHCPHHAPLVVDDAEGNVLVGRPRSEAQDAGGACGRRGRWVCADGLRVCPASVGGRRLYPNYKEGRAVRIPWALHMHQNRTVWAGGVPVDLVGGCHRLVQQLGVEDVELVALRQVEGRKGKTVRDGRGAWWGVRWPGEYSRSSEIARNSGIRGLRGMAKQAGRWAPASPAPSWAVGCLHRSASGCTCSTHTCSIVE